MRIDQAAIQAYADATDDHNPLHVDAEFASTTRFARPIAFGTLVLNALWSTLAASGRGDGGLRLRAKFVAPVFAGDTVSAFLAEESGGVTPFEIRSGDGRLVIVGEVEVRNGDFSS